MVLRARRQLPPYARCLGDLLRDAAAAVPERTFLAERDAAGGWRRVAYGEALAAVERLAAALAGRGLDERRPVAILSENGIDNALLQLAAMHAGIPAAPVSPAYSLQSRDFAKLRALVGQLRPGLIYAEDGGAYAPALAATVEAAGGPVEVVVSSYGPSGPAAVIGSAPGSPGASGPPGAPAATLFADLLAAPPAADAAAAARGFAAVGPDTVAKILFTSGSTGAPKGVINTQRMLCSNQEAIAQGWPFLGDRPPVIVDWLPWSHTFGGNHNFNMMLRHRGTLHVDRGKPAPGAVETTVRNLREISGTLYFNVPRGFDVLLPYLESDAALRDRFFAELDAVFYAAAALPQHLWERLERLSLAATGRRVAMLSAWGSTETAPCATQVHFPIDRAGVIGVPVPGTEIKLAPAGDKLEIRVRGPNVSPGYWRHEAGAADAFDEEGFLRTGDAGRLADPDDPSRGLVFDGRIAENFKLLSGTWVHVGELRTALLAAGAPVIQDLVVTGHGRDAIGLLVFPNPAACRALCPAAPAGEPLDELLRRPAVREALRTGLAAHNAANPANSRRVTCALLLAEPPSIDAGEITDKGYVNQRAVLTRRAALVDRLYAAPEAPDAGGAPGAASAPATTGAPNAPDDAADSDLIRL
jgi:feruloyl-CoA synthase